MRVIRSIKQMSDYARRARAQGKTIGFVPTMGYLHEGHLSLMRRARRETALLVISIFVNPMQFGRGEDLKKYPRDFLHDKQLSKRVGVDVIFFPSARSMYAPNHSTYVNVKGLTEGLCGRSRPGHFQGVATVVAKLFNIVKPDIAYFGGKDRQQAMVIKRMAEDLNMDIRIKILPIVRERDGLAMSSRNTRLKPRERKDAIILYKSLQTAKNMIESKQRNPGKIISTMRRMIEKKKTARIDYISIVDARNLVSVNKISGRVLIALAVKIGKTRLIDNIVVNG